MIDTFLEEISLYPNGKYLIVQLSNVNPCQYIAAVLNGKGLKVTSARKLFFAINQPLRCNEQIFLFEEKIIFHSLDFQVLSKSTNFKVREVIMILLHMRRYTFDYFFRTLKSIKLKFGQMLMLLTGDIPNLFLAQL